VLDRLTGVVNRAYFMKRLTQEIERCNRYQMPVGVLMIDVDNFKPINDTLGHPQGDAVLKIIAKLVKRDVRVIDLVGRYGGEEFIVMLPEAGVGAANVEPTSKAVLVAERIRRSIEEEFRGLKKPLAVTISIGVVVRRPIHDRHMAAQDMVRISDEQLYKAKTSGKNRYCVFEPEDAGRGAERGGPPSQAETWNPAGKPPMPSEAPTGRAGEPPPTASLGEPTRLGGVEGSTPLPS
jgi:diguanylate cyclase (GGDEF)-like protein